MCQPSLNFPHCCLLTILLFIISSLCPFCLRTWLTCPRVTKYKRGGPPPTRMSLLHSSSIILRLLRLTKHPSGIPPWPLRFHLCQTKPRPSAAQFLSPTHFHKQALFPTWDINKPVQSFCINRGFFIKISQVLKTKNTSITHNIRISELASIPPQSTQKCLCSLSPDRSVLKGRTCQHTLIKVQAI